MLKSNLSCAVIALIIAVTISSAYANGYLKSEIKLKFGDEKLGQTYQ